MELDCETSDTTVRSLSSLTGVSDDDIFTRLSAWTWSAFERFARRRGIGGYDIACAELWRRVFRDLPHPVPATVYWFHATRVLPDADFAEGLLPLPLAVPRLLESLGRIGLRPASVRAKSFHRDAHKEKMKHRGSWGPFGHLVRNAAFSPVQNHFFRAPEAVVDLGFDLDAFRAATVPCIVKFRATDPRDDVAELALFYAYLAVWRKPADWDCSTTWGGDGRAARGHRKSRIP
jgi:hypothetical protein